MLSKYAINDIYYVINYVFMLSIRCNNTSKIIPGMGQISTLGTALSIDLIFATGNIYVKEGIIGGIFMFNRWGVVLNNTYNSY